MWNEELIISRKCAVEAGKLIIEIYKDTAPFSIEQKVDQSPLTAADKVSNRIIIKALKKSFPAYAILSEEGENSKDRLQNDLCFVVDPLDGTKEFIKRNGQFTVNIALSYKHRIVMGVIYVPVTGELYYASKGEGAYFIEGADIEIAEKNARRIRVSDRTEGIRCVMSSSHSCQEMDSLIEKYQIKNFVRIGSSLKGCLIAKGEAEIYYRFNPTMEWDTAAMQCIVEEAGGIFRQMDDTEMLYNREDSLNNKGFYVINCEMNKLTL